MNSQSLTIRRPCLHPLRLKRKKPPMTIAIGFAYDTGLLFCVDTKVSTDIKTNESKIEHRVSDDTMCSLTFAISSTDLNFPRTAIDKCWEYVRQMDFATVSIQAVHDAAEFSLAEFYRDHIYPHPDRTPGQLFLELLVGIWLRGKTRLYLSHETLLTPVDGYECIGSGAYLAKYLIRQYRTANPNTNSIQDAGLIANLAVESAIDYDEHCGGEAEMFIVRNSGTLDSICPAVLYPGHGLMGKIQSSAWKLLHDLAEVSDNFETETASRIEEYCQELKAANDECRWHFESIREQKIRDPHRWD
jgi:hypothetical protein